MNKNLLLLNAGTILFMYYLFSSTISESFGFLLHKESPFKNVFLNDNFKKLNFLKTKILNYTEHFQCPIFLSFFFFGL